jgi:ATP-dependent exoDNAse (exonuclease V) beta subunit
MVRKFREVREALKKIPGSWNAFTESRFEDFIKCAAEFEEMRDSTIRLSDFIDFVSRKKRRDFAEPGMVRIMTMHQSKGLGFDWVILPLYESGKMVDEHHTGPLKHYSPDWITVNPGSAIAMTDAVLAEAEKARRHVEVYNSLCLNYVAMTRAKIAMTVILNPPNKTPPSQPEKFSDLCRLVKLETQGDPSWYVKFKREDQSGKTQEEKPSLIRRRREAVKKSRPSESFFSGLKGDSLFDDNFGKAAERGTRVHAEFEKIEWAQGEALLKLPEGFCNAFTKKTSDDLLWREKTYELFTDGKWETGQFDRVVFSTLEGEKSAIIYDFKTNAIRDGESKEDFKKRLCDIYSGQMSSYKRALSLLTGIRRENIQTILLSTTIGEEISVS